MDKIQMVNLTQKIVQEFNRLTGPVDLAMLLKNDFTFNKDNNESKYTLLFSSKSLDDMSPFDSTLEVVKFFRKYNPDILKKISRIITIHSEDESVCKIKELMHRKNEDFFIDSEGLELFGTTIKDAIILKFEDISVLG